MKTIITSLLCLVMLFPSCINKEFPTPEVTEEEETKKGVDEYFDFKTTAGVTLSLDYGFKGYSSHFELYLTNPYDENGQKIETSLPYFGAFTDFNSRFSQLITIPAYTKKVYVCSDYVGIPTMLTLDVVNDAISYTYTSPTSRNVGYEGECISINATPSPLQINNSSLYKLYEGYEATLTASNGTYYLPYNRSVPAIYSLVENTTQLTPSSTLGQLMQRITATLYDAGKKKDNSDLCRSGEITNLRIRKTTDAGVQVDNAHVDLVFIEASGDFHNAMGYYYYKSDEALTVEQIKKLPKFMVFPRTTRDKPNHRIKARLQFYGEDYKQIGVDHFPSGYTIGWILISNLFEDGSSKDNIKIDKINDKIADAYSSNSVYSDNLVNTDSNYGCISVWDELSEKLVIGFEDQAYKTGSGDKSFEDILFYVDCDPIDAIRDEDRPGTKDPEEEIYTSTRTSTLAYEDIWPTGGDYDMNDVVVEYVQEVTYNNFNKLKKINDSFKVAHSGATLENGFGISFLGAVQEIDNENSLFFVKEETNQYMMIENVKISVGNTYNIIRTFGETGVDKATYETEIVPFIAPSYKPGEKNRVEVHLPKATATPWANLSLQGTGSDAFYIDVEGKYPFAFELIDVTDWEVVTERSRIGSVGEYPLYNSWAESRGATHTDWYKYKD